MSQVYLRKLTKLKIKIVDMVLLQDLHFQDKELYFNTNLDLHVCIIIISFTNTQCIHFYVKCLI